jgi:iron complex transport system substrate-binding protein
MALLSRRTALALVAALTAPAALAGCSTGSTTDQVEAQAQTEVEADAFPVTIEHAFGRTTIEEEPERVATLGWTDQDNALALGVVPVAATKLTWGGNEQGSSDWFDAELEKMGAEQPVRYDDADGAPVEEVAQARPDLILATNSGITRAEYEKLSKIAPVVAYPEAAWVTPWQTSLEMTGQALGRPELAAEVAHETKGVIRRAREENPEIQGRSVIFGYLSTADMSTAGVYLPQDPRVGILNDLGMTNPPVVEDLVKDGEFYGTVSAERASSLESDVFLTYAEKEDDLQTFADDKLLGQIPALASGHAYAEPDKELGLAVTNPSPLSIPVIVEDFLPHVVDAARGSAAEGDTE